MVKHASKYNYLSSYSFMLVLVVIALVFTGWYIYHNYYFTSTEIISSSKGTITIDGILESAQSPGPDRGVIDTVKTSDGHVWAARNCGFINLPSATVDNITVGGRVKVYGILDKQESYTIDLCGSSNYFVKKY